MLLELLLGLTVILIGAELFTNGIEWLGVRMKFSEGAVGSVLSAVGTALPESMIPVVAILFNPSESSSHIGIGAILGAPFMLGTLAFFITGLSARMFLWRKDKKYYLNVDCKVVSNDIIFFIIMYSLAMGASFIGFMHIKKAIAILLILGYGYYVKRTFKSGDRLGGHNLRALYCNFSEKPRLRMILLQIFVALTAIILGAHYFVSGIETLAMKMKIPYLVLALIIAPIATELPEKFNSVLWISQKKDTLAIGNITGAMVFQSSLLPALGILTTPWDLNGISLLSGILVLISALVLLISLKRNRFLKTSSLMFSGIFYLIFISIVLWAMFS
ncbi:cation:H+ antiporter [Desulfonispora thiosulfatigenes DSM 11270]|uniref:Cation:H+ antiporter n=1 Tax=Desulfonispora thiosulfatigenes DSM 11270 TaxID=656914 RepID=A0A1W1V7F7_DESTI|nr:sodium:calcium antiporter [Desulfonispora thiosulfatigenes]SMB89319.1 cation:H+ antiporter [Desulfonispora thiosulfatigenes DSM 11270]